MVFTTAALMVRSRGPSKFWNRRRLFRLTAHFFGRSRNCYSIAIRYAHRALVYATKARALKKNDIRDLWAERIKAGCEENNVGHYTMIEGLERAGVMLNNKSLADLAIWEPRTFAALTAVAQQRAILDNLPLSPVGQTPTGVDLEDEPILRSQFLDKKK